MRVSASLFLFTKRRRVLCADFRRLNEIQDHCRVEGRDYACVVYALYLRDARLRDEDEDASANTPAYR